MKDIERYWKAEFENGETIIVRALDKRTAWLFAECETDNDVVKLEEIEQKE